MGLLLLYFTIFHSLAHLKSGELQIVCGVSIEAKKLNHFVTPESQRTIIFHSQLSFDGWNEEGRIYWNPSSSPRVKSPWMPSAYVRASSPIGNSLDNFLEVFQFDIQDITAKNNILRVGDRRCHFNESTLFTGAAISWAPWHEHAHIRPQSYRGYRVLTLDYRALIKDQWAEVPTDNNLATLNKKYLYMQISMIRNHG